MYLDEGGDGNGDIKVTVDHHDYDVQANYSSHHDGVDDTAMQETDHGYVGFTDSHHEGRADLMTTFDDQGHVTGQARLDEPSGEWISVDPNGGDHGDPSGETAHRDAHDMRVDLPDGERDIGPATEDTDGDGKPDTAVVTTDDGGMILYTDRDGDGEADQSTEVDANGNVTVKVHEGHGGWKTVQTGHLDENGKYVPDGRSSVGSGASAGAPSDGLLGWGADAGLGLSGGGQDSVHLDPSTGEWISAGS